MNFTIDQWNHCYKTIIIEICLTHNEGKFVVSEKLIRTLTNKTLKYMASILKNMYFDIFDDMFYKYNKTYHRTIKMKPIEVKASAYINFGV